MEDPSSEQTSSDISLSMKFELATIEHLGISMYAKLNPVLAEMVANCYDADASQVVIDLIDQSGKKKILIQDDGKGMSFQDINDKFLLIGRNRRELGEDSTSKYKRKVIGRKGIGKLSVFGIADEIIVTTIKEGVKNKFRMYLPDIKANEHKKEYNPEHLIINQKCNEEEKSGTLIEMGELKRKSSFSHEEIAIDLAKRFLVFTENFKVIVRFNQRPDQEILIKNELRLESIEKEFTWELPKDAPPFTTYDKKNEVKGFIYTGKKPVPAYMKGVYLVARGKLVNNNELYVEKESDYAHEYITGWLNVDFIDENNLDDNISTNRESLNWEKEETEKLREYLKEVISLITKEWRKKRKTKKEEIIKEIKGIDIPSWLESLPVQERKLAKKMTDLALNNPDIDEDRTAELVEYVKDSFEFDSFKEFATKLEDSDDITSHDLLTLFKDWEIIESKEMNKLALVRIETIKQFEKKIKNNAKEVPEMHNFLKTFPWLLDPRIYNFKDEVTYSELLRENFKEDEEPEENKRIDFLCIDLADTIFIIELKRPKIKANDKYLDQALKYSSFIREKKGNDPNFSQRTIKTYLICDGVVNVPSVREKAASYSETGRVYIKTYLELLQNARNYHQEFIDKYEKLKK